MKRDAYDSLANSVIGDNGVGLKRNWLLFVLLLRSYSYRDYHIFALYFYGLKLNIDLLFV